eukprot:366113-Chlamydomonas_euryale.AAC.26
MCASVPRATASLTRRQRRSASSSRVAPPRPDICSSSHRSSSSRPTPAVTCTERGAQESVCDGMHERGSVDSCHAMNNPACQRHACKLGIGVMLFLRFKVVGISKAAVVVGEGGGAKSVTGSISTDPPVHHMLAPTSSLLGRR